jgi:hypothetical protein
MFEQTVPLSYGTNALHGKALWIAHQNAKLDSIGLDTMQRANDSAILEAIHIASIRLLDTPQGWAKRIIIISDMRQLTPRVFNFEKKVPEAS